MMRASGTLLRFQAHVLMVLTYCSVTVLCLASPEPSMVEDTELAKLVQHLDADDVSEDEPGFLRQIRKYSRRLWHINCSARRRRLCHCYSRQLRQYFCCDCDSGPCFPGDALVDTPNGTVLMANLTVGQLVLAGNAEGHVVSSRVLGFLDKRPHEEAVYTTLQTARSAQVTLSGNHLIFVTARENASQQAEAIATARVRPGQFVLTLNSDTPVLKLRPDPVVAVHHALNTGAYVPLTEHGTLIVGGTLASCYASFPHDLAHWALAPARLAPTLLLDSEQSQHEHGVRFFPKLLKTLGRALLPEETLDPHTRVLKFDLRPFD